MKVIDYTENKNLKLLYKLLTKQLSNTNTFESQINILKNFYNSQPFTRIDLINRMRELERDFKYDSSWYGEQYIGVILGFGAGSFLDIFQGKHILTVVIYMFLFWAYIVLSLKKDLRKYRKIENQLYEINCLELELIKILLTKNESEFDVDELIDKIALEKPYFKK